MGSLDLPTICAVAFAAVFVLLTILATVMRIIIAVFPQKAEGSDQAAVAAIVSVVSTLYPGTRITNIEEEK
jgi:uncharacterized membrane protein HdeD (DUF308 family)